jgi:hypothetical protein
MHGGIILKVIDAEHCEVRWPAYDSKIKTRRLMPDFDSSEECNGKAANF